MAKKKKAPQLEAWCWYCDREFEDDKVLLQHQKAKHYKCSFCPRRLNTAGGLTVHLHQVHKAEPTKIENALPGRESFDIEIYGMVGVPEADLAEWKSRRANNGSMGGGPSGQPGAKRQKVENIALTPEQLKAQLEAHKALMSGQAPPPGSAPPHFGTTPAPPLALPQGFPPHYGQPPPAFQRPPPGFPGGPPPGFSPYGGPAAPPRPWAPGLYGGPPPNITTPQPSPHQVAVRKGDKSRMVYTDSTMSPEEKMASSSRYAYVDPDNPPLQQEVQHIQPPPAHAWPQQQHEPPSGSPAAYYGPPPGWQAGPPPALHAAYPPHPPTSQGSSSPYTAPYQQNGAGSSPYPSARPPPPSSYATPPPPGGFGVPPPTPYGVPPPPHFASSPPPPFPPQMMQYPPPSALTSSASSPPLSSPPPPPPPSQQAQSYPAIPPNALPPASNPEANTAEALASVNGQVSLDGPAAGGAVREVEAQTMEKRADEERKEDEKEVTEVATTTTTATTTATTETGTGTGTPTGTTPTPRPAGRRARAADLF